MQTIDTERPASFKNVLVATDFGPASQGAFQTALSLCSTCGGKLTILHVFEFADVVPLRTTGQLTELEDLYKQARMSLDELVRMGCQAGVACEPVIGGGVAPLAILEMIREKQIDLAVLGTNALHGFERLIFGSTAESVLRKAPCPVLTVGPLASMPAMPVDQIGPVVFATDFDAATVRAATVAASFCKVTGSPLHCLHVLPRTLEGGEQVIPPILTKALTHLFTESATPIEPHCAIAYGSEVSHAIVDYARQHQAKLIVLGVREASMAASHVPAHIAYRVITEAPCPVLTVAFATKPFALEQHASRIAACL